MAKRKSANSSVGSLKHKDKRKNIPTAELQDFAKEDEVKPKKILYPRDPSLDPQLVWKGKDEQDQKSLEVPAVPVYIQEKIQPQVLIEDLRRNSPLSKGARGLSASEQPNLFADFNGLEFENLIEFYQHEQNWSNRLILGDSLLVMNSLAEKEGLKGKVQMIYFDPPYGIRFGSNWQVSTRKRDIKDGKAEDLTRQPEQIRAFRDTWELGIHSYLSYLRDRLVIARELLTETGSVFVQIGDENVHLVRCLMDEVFGSENFVSQITFTKTRSLVSSEFITTTADFLLWYGKTKELTKIRKPLKQGINHDLISHYEDEAGNVFSRVEGEKIIESNPMVKLKPFMSDNLIRKANPEFTITFEGKQYTGRYRTNPQGMEHLAQFGRLFATENQLRYKFFLSDYPVSTYSNVWDDVIGARDIIYVVQTNTTVIQRCLLMTTDPGDLVLDPTCGSGTTAYVAEQWGRRWITIDTSRVALALARTRIMSAKYPYYILADSQEGIEKEIEVSFSRHSRENGNPGTKELDARLRTSGMTKQKDEDVNITVEIKGLDVYDPTTGQIRSHSTDDIACWFIDTDYNEESFFVRHAYFSGADEPYEKLKKALKVEIDESAWSTLYSTKSRPFPIPSKGKIAIKVINHYGDEVLKVYEVREELGWKH